MTDLSGGLCRLARPDEIHIVRDIQRAAGRLFLESPFPELAAEEPDTAEDLAQAQDEWRLWLSVTPDDRPVGAVRVLIRDEELHLRQMDVHPDHAGARRTLGMLRGLSRFFGGRGLRRATLTTFADVPWNAPYYARIGFEAVSGDEMSTDLARSFAEEGAVFPADSRVAMARTL